MFNKLEYQQFVELAAKHKRIVVHQEIAGDTLTPINAYLALQDHYQDFILLESSPKEKHRSRYSHLCLHKLAEIKSHANKVTIEYNNETKQSDAEPFTVLREYQKKLRAHAEHKLAKLVGGMVGYLSYDAIRLFENIPDSNGANDIPEILFRFYENSISFDHQTGKIVIATVATVSKDLEGDYAAALSKLQQITDRLSEPVKKNDTLASNTNVVIETDVNDEEYKSIVNKAKQYIVAGDIFQVVPSRQFQVPTKVEPFAIYRALKYASPSPYMFYLECGDFTIAGASPEKLVNIENNLIESCPLAGTRPKTNTAQDELIATELLQDVKESAEHMMLVDLSRNDLGRVAEPGSVKVVKLKQVEHFSRVMHISSTVQGQLRTDKDVFDVLQASFPAGTLSGAPKIRAMQIIDELETSRRGIYGGAICAIDCDGDLESCIAIRMAVIKDGVATVRAGGGVVFDSDPQAEADETRHKARAILEGITLAAGGAI